MAVSANWLLWDNLNTISGGLECVFPVTHGTSIVSRLDNYCRAAGLLGASLLIFDLCDGLKDVYNDCISSGSHFYGTCKNCDSPVEVPQPTHIPTTIPTTALCLLDADMRAVAKIL